MADVHIHQNPPSTNDRGMGALWGVVVFVLVVLVAWFFLFRGGLERDAEVDVEVTPPAVEATGGATQTP